GGQRVFTLDQEGDLHAWDTAGGPSPRRIASGVEQGVVASPDGRFLAWAVVEGSGHRNAAHTGSRVRRYDVATERFMDRSLGIKDDVSVRAVMPDGKAVLTLDPRAALVRLWDLESGKEQRSFSVSPEAPEDLPYVANRAVLSPDRKTLAVGYDRAD